MNTNTDELDDDQFFAAHWILCQALEKDIPQKDIDDAACIVIDFCEESGDRLAWSLLFARFEDFLRAGKTPPAPILCGLADVFKKFRTGNSSMDVAFGLKEKGIGGGRRKAEMDLLKRERSRTDAGLVDYFLSKDIARDEAYKKVQTFNNGPNNGEEKGSIATIRRHHEAYGKEKTIKPKKGKK